MSDDGHRLRQSWASALSNAEAQFRALLISSSSAAWKRVLLPASPPQRKSNHHVCSDIKGKGRVRPAQVLTMHRRQTNHGETMRVVLDVALEGSLADLDKWRAVLATPEVRVDWDPSVESSTLVEMFDWNTRITRTNYSLGWPANPRDAVTICKTYHDTTTLIDISTSLPRSLDEPAYLRPAPPYVRSHVHLFAWCIQMIRSQHTNEDSLPITPSNNKLRITCFWQHDFKAVWALSSSLSQQLPTMVQGLLRVVQKRGHRLPLLCAYGTGVALERILFEVGREALTVEYAIVQEDEDDAPAVKDLEEVNKTKERKRLERSIEYIFPNTIGWDVQISTRASSDIIAALPWKVSANRTSTSTGPGNTIFRIHHSSLPDIQSILKVKMVIEFSGGASGLRINGLPHSILDAEPRDPMSFTLSRQMKQDTSSVSALSFHSLSTGDSSGEISSSSVPPRSILYRGGTNRTSTAEKMISSRVKRNYIYFSSLLQEPEAKWKRNSEARGVTVSQLDSIDPTLVVYRAEAVFVGVGLWDLYSTIASPGTRVNWDKGHEDAVLLEDVNELTELWHWRTKPSWPVNARDVVLLKTVYKSPNTVHVFSFSTDDTQLFTSIPPPEPNVIRMQVDLQGWAIETLSPTTTLLTLLEQSDPRGWTGKSSIPQQMINAVAGVGEFVIKSGGPPVNTRLGGARSLSARYDHDKGSFKLEYEGCENRRSNSTSVDTSSNDRNSSSATHHPNEARSPDVTLPATIGSLPYIECELRCDLDVWASSLEIVIDPPPQAVSCLRRHRLSSRGGGLWLTIGHDAVFTGEERLLAIVRKGTSKEKGSVVVNGAKVKVDVEELPENEVKALTKVKRVKPVRVPLDQPPVLSVIRRHREEWNEESDGDNSPEAGGTTATKVMRWAASAPRFSSPLANFWTRAVQQTTATTSVAVNIAAVSLGGAAVTSPLSPHKPPMAYALSALEFLRNLHTNFSPDGWNLVNDKEFPVHRKLFSEISTSIPVHKGEKVIEGVSAEEVAHIVNDYDLRTNWDDRFDSAVVLEEFGTSCHTAFVVSKCGFPFRDRGFYLASTSARLLHPLHSSPSLGDHSGIASPHPHASVIFCASASFSPSSVENFDVAKYNPHGLPIGHVMIQGWIFETLDPYTAENYAIPSTKCTYIGCVDYAGSVPTALNSLLNAALPRVILTVDQHLKSTSCFPVVRLPTSTLALVARNDSRDVGDFASPAFGWRFEQTDEFRTLVSKRYDSSTKKFWSTILVSPKSQIPERPPSPVSSPTTSSTSTIRTRRISAASSTIPLGHPLSQEDACPAPSSPSADFHTVNTSYVDFLIGELVVDSKLYPNGFEVRVASHLRDAQYASQPFSLSSLPIMSSDLPVSCTCHVLPSTPLHSSGLNVDSPSRHLLRFTLPTAKYDGLVDEPLSLQPPEKPGWLTDLQSNGAIVEIVVFSTVEGGQNRKGLIIVDGSIVEIMNEKESIRSLRQELDNERLEKMPILCRTPLTAGTEEIPQALIKPVASATALYNSRYSTTQPSELGTMFKEAEKGSDREQSAGDDAHSEATVSVGIIDHWNIERDLSSQDSHRSHLDDAEAVIAPQPKFLSFLDGYPNIFLKRGSRALDFFTTASSSPVPGSQPTDRRVSPGFNIKTETRNTRLFPLSTVLVIGLISFLLGSLLRSLLTPADYVYISPNMNELENGRKGWREIKRLVEVRRVVGGWDLLIGIIRRH